MTASKPNSMDDFLKAARQGEVATYKFLTTGRVYQLVEKQLRISGLKDSFDQSDAIYKVAEKIARAAKSGNTIEYPKAYLARCLKNAAYDCHKKKKAERERKSAINDHFIKQIPPPTGSKWDRATEDKYDLEKAKLDREFAKIKALDKWRFDNIYRQWEYDEKPSSIARSHLLRRVGHFQNLRKLSFEEQIKKVSHRLSQQYLAWYGKYFDTTPK